TATNRVALLDYAGTMEFSRAGAQAWDSVYRTNFLFEIGDRGRTGPRSRALLELSDLTMMRLGERTEFLVKPATVATQSITYSFLQGLIRVLHRGTPGSARWESKTAVAATRGTEFNIEVDPAGRMVLTVIEGEAVLTSAGVTTNLLSGEQGIADP